MNQAYANNFINIFAEFTINFFRVQPHLKKCFEGIAKLNFTENMEVTDMISTEGEVVKLVDVIDTNQANGMVEKWLVELLVDMKKSVRAMVSLI